MLCCELGKGKGLVSLVPNQFKTINQENSGFDTQFVTLEKQWSLGALVFFVIGMIGSGLFYSLTKSNTTHEEFNPTIARYYEIAGTTDIVGKPTCPCSTTQIQEAIFISSVSFDLDIACSINTTVIEPIEVVNQQRTYYTLYQPPPVGINSVTPYNICVGLSNQSESAADCAVINSLALLILEKLQEECAFASSMHQREVRLLVEQKLYTVNAMDKEVLNTYLQSDFDTKALRSGLRMLARVTGSILMAVDTDWSHISSTNSNFQDDTQYSAACLRIRGSSGTEFRIRDALRECFASGTFPYRCCGKMNTNCSQVERLPCTPPMVELGRVLNESEYADMTELTEYGFLKGMDAGSRNNIHSGGYYVNRSVLSGAWESYFEACAPNECHYNTYGYPDAQDLLLILSGLVGGIYGIAINMFLVGLMSMKRAIMYGREKKLEKVVEPLPSPIDPDLKEVMPA